MSDETNVILVGMGGYGEVYLTALLEAPEMDDVRLVAAVDPAPERCRRLDQVRGRGIPIYSSLEDVTEWSPRCLTVIASPIQHHCEQTLLALSRGSHVLCEKPAAASVADVDRMIAASVRHDRFVAIGFQWSFTHPILALKRDIHRGVFGRPRRLKSLTLWPRRDGYYARNGWAGRKADADGRPVLDSPANNAMAHDLHNMLFLLGDGFATSARPVEVEAETWRAYDIETFDTIAARILTDTDAELFFYASHVTEVPRDPTFEIECTEAVIRYPGGLSPITAQLSDGTKRTYPSPGSEDQACKLWTCIRALDGEPLPCTAASARSHAMVIETIARTSETQAFPAARLRHDESPLGPRTFVADLREELTSCFEAGTLPQL